MPGTLVGAYGAEKPADDDVKALFASPEVHASLATHLGEAVTSFEVEAFKTQVVAGVNYKVKGLVNDSEAVIVTAHKPLPHTHLPLEIKSAVKGSEL